MYIVDYVVSKIIIIIYSPPFLQIPLPRGACCSLFSVTLAELAYVAHTHASTQPSHRHR